MPIDSIPVWTSVIHGWWTARDPKLPAAPQKCHECNGSGVFDRID